MPTAILDLDIKEPPCSLSLPERYDRALVLVRLHGQPIGQVRLPVVGGRLGTANLQHELHSAINWSILQNRLREHLHVAQVPTSTSLPAATVAVCTRDRPEDLQRCLCSLLRLPDDGQEVLVIDNCPSTDASWQIVQSYEGQVRYAREDRPGLDCARNRALREAKHKVVAFIDDDASADPYWLRALVRSFADPLVLCATGLTMPLELETEAQECFELYSSFNRGFARKVYSQSNLEPALAGHVGAGANMALRRDVLDLVGPFDEALDAGTRTFSGGDNEMFARILATGYHIVYDPAALNWHRHRRTWKELYKTFYGYGRGVYAAWTRSLLFERELSVLPTAWRWFRRTQFPGLVRAIRHRPGSPPPRLLLAELAGCATGPFAYLRSRKSLLTRSN